MKTTTNAVRSPRVLRLLALALLVVTLASGPARGQGADFSTYVSLGDSLTAAFMSGALIADAQVVSYPQLIYSQATGQVSGFEQPLVSSPGLPPILQLRSLSPLVISPAAGAGTPLNLQLPRPYNNLAVPGADVADVLSRVTDGGGLHDLILRGVGTQVQQAIGLGASFVTLWAGNNDVLGAATSGIVIEGVTLTPLAEFEATYRTIVGALVANGVTGLALGTIPDVTAIPFVTTLPPVLIDPATGQPVVVNGNFVPLLGPDGPLGPGDFVLLTASSELAQGRGIPAPLGPGIPLSDQAVLSASEASAVANRVNAINQVIRTVAGEVGAAVADVNTVFADIAVNGIEIGGVEYTADFLTGGLFSFDGVHATQLGYALIANEFIRAINAAYGADISLVGLSPFLFTDIGQAPGVGTVPAAPGEFIFTKKAYRSLRKSLNVPSPKRLARLKRRMAASDGSARVARAERSPRVKRSVERRSSSRR